MHFLVPAGYGTTILTTFFHKNRNNDLLTKSEFGVALYKLLPAWKLLTAHTFEFFYRTRMWFALSACTVFFRFADVFPGNGHQHSQRPHSSKFKKTRRSCLQDSQRYQMEFWLTDVRQCFRQLFQSCETIAKMWIFSQITNHVLYCLVSHCLHSHVMINGTRRAYSEHSGVNVTFCIYLYFLLLCWSKDV